MSAEVALLAKSVVCWVTVDVRTVKSFWDALPAMAVSCSASLVAWLVALAAAAFVIKFCVAVVVLYGCSAVVMSAEEALPAKDTCNSFIWLCVAYAPLTVASVVPACAAIALFIWVVVLYGCKAVVISADEALSATVVEGASKTLWSTLP